MNILFLSTENPYPPDHGHYIRTYNVLKHVSRHHNVHFLGFIKSKEGFKNVEPIREMCKTADVFIMPDDVSRARLYLSLFLNLFSPLPYIAQKYYRKSMKLKVEEILRKNKIDVVHFDMLHMSRYQTLMSDVPTVLTEHNVESLRIHRLLKNSNSMVFKAFMYLQYFKLKNFEKRACARFDACAAVSDDDMRVLKSMCPGANLVVIPNGVDTDYFAPDDTHAIPDSLVWVGGMNNMYNREAVDFFLEEIFPLIRGRIPDVKLTVVGKSPTRRLLHLADGNKNIEVAGYADDVRPYIRKAAVYVAPIKSGGGTKLKVLNALSMAKPVVTTSVGAEGIDVIDGEHLVIADDPIDFADRTVELLRNTQYAASLAEKGRRLMVEKYDWEIIGRKMNRLYEEVVASKSDIQTTRYRFQ